MADPADRADVEQQVKLDGDIDAIRQAAANIPKGEAGYCFYCGEHFARIVNDACGRCRDELGLD